MLGTYKLNADMCNINKRRDSTTAGTTKTSPQPAGFATGDATVTDNTVTWTKIGIQSCKRTLDECKKLGNTKRFWGSRDWGQAMSDLHNTQSPLIKGARGLSYQRDNSAAFAPLRHIALGVNYIADNKCNCVNINIYLYESFEILIYVCRSIPARHASDSLVTPKSSMLTGLVIYVMALL